METTVTNIAELVKDVEFGAILSEIKSLVPIVLPVSIAFIAFRKGMGFLFSSLRKA